MQVLLLLLALVPAVLFSQIPEFFQQYRQRLGGAAQELAIVVRNFDEDAARSGYTRRPALDVMGRNSERLVREQGQRMTGYIVRLQKLQKQEAAFVDGVTPSSIVTVARDYDEEIIRQVWSSYVFAVPATMMGLFFALFGLLLGYLLLYLPVVIFGTRSRVALR